MKRTIAYIMLFLIFTAFAVTIVRTAGAELPSPDIGSLFKIESKYFNESNETKGLELVYVMRTNVKWEKLNGLECADAELTFPAVPEDLALVILTDCTHIAVAQWDLTSGQSLHAYFYPEDMMPMYGKTGLYILLFRYANGIYYDIY